MRKTTPKIGGVAGVSPAEGVAEVSRSDRRRGGDFPHQRHQKLIKMFLIALIAVACTNTYLYDGRRDDEVPNDRALTVRGEFCTPASDEVKRPIKVLIAMDASQSMEVTDPLGSRAKATIDLIDNLPQEPEVSFVVMLFAGSTTAWLNKNALCITQGTTTPTCVPRFEQVTSYSVADKIRLREVILNFAAPGNMANRDSTDFVKPLTDMYALINRDIANLALVGGTQETRGRYSVIFLSDGQPTINQDRELLCGDGVRRLRQLKDLADDVRVNTAHVFQPTQVIASTNCDIDGGYNPPGGARACIYPTLPAAACPLLLVNQNADRLKQMAALGGGQFRDFRNNEPINFLNFAFGQVRRTYVFDKLVVSNFSAPPQSAIELADTDSDGLLDRHPDPKVRDEAKEGTNPWVADTDGDGFSDGVEVYFRQRLTANGAAATSFNPNQRMLPDGGGVDRGCPAELRGVDQDCDGLTDCDEQIIGTNALRADSDDDGVPDSVEFKLGTQPASDDLRQDVDNDGLSNADEVSFHLDPLEVDSANLSVDGYRVKVTRVGSVESGTMPLADGGSSALLRGRQCFSFEANNVLLANTAPDTRDAGNPDGGAPFFRRGAGYNDIFVSYSMKPADDATGRTAIRMLRNVSSRFPVGGIKSPHDGVISVTPDDFRAGCQR
jgi:hypothetical protein